jgi:hypothetical protein
MSAPMIGSGGKPLIGSGGTPMVGEADCDCCGAVPDPVGCTACPGDDISNAPGAWQVDLPTARISCDAVELAAISGGSFLCDQFTSYFDVGNDAFYCEWLGPFFEICQPSSGAAIGLRPYVRVTLAATGSSPEVIDWGWVQIREDATDMLSATVIFGGSALGTTLDDSCFDTQSDMTTPSNSLIGLEDGCFDGTSCAATNTFDLAFDDIESSATPR